MSYKYVIKTFGCQMNYSDSERMSAFLQNLGLVETNNLENADLIILNTCSVRQKAEDRINGIVKNIRLSVGNHTKIVITGCMARRSWNDTTKTKSIKYSFQKSQRERYEEILKNFPLVDYVIETKEFTKIGDWLAQIFNKPEWKRENQIDKPEHYLSFEPKYKSSFQAYVPISTGCNHFCTFCIVPYSRGKEYCRPATEIIREVFDLVQRGYKDITLLGQTVNRWINNDFKQEFNYNEALTKIDTLNEMPMSDKDLNKWRKFFQHKLELYNNNKNVNLDNNKSDFFSTVRLKMPRDFLQLLQVLDQIPGAWWTTWISSHPNYLTEKLIQYVGLSAKNMLYGNFAGHQRPYIHFALQSGSNKILKIMNRRYSYEEFYEKVKLIRKYVPEVSISTDIIVGFVNETEEDFMLTVKAHQECNFDTIYISEYSPRIGTAAYELKETVDNKTKAKRKEFLNNILQKSAEIKNSKLLNTITYALIEEYLEKKKILKGKTSHNKDIVLNIDEKLIPNKSNDELVGKFVEVKINGFTPWALKGIINKILY
ncbi:MAG: radical SAM protein [Candidatus Dojkabacteria bacterium]|nr:radical SAM protein [Candidatus Dojkabacteria bacterium]